MIPDVPATPPTPAQLPQATTTPVQTRSTATKVASAEWQQQSPLTSPNLKTTPKLPRLVAQSELPGGNTPPAPPVPTEPSQVDTGNGYSSRTPLNYVGPAIGFGDGKTAVGAVTRFPVLEKYSLRPSAVFGSTTTVRVPITYDFQLGDREPFERNPLVTFYAGGGAQFTSGNNQSKVGLLGTIGIDVNLFEGSALTASYNTDFASNNGVLIGLGFEF